MTYSLQMTAYDPQKKLDMNVRFVSIYTIQYINVC